MRIIDLQNILGYHFKDENLLKEALSHPSLHSNISFHGKDYERLEFLGDAVINLVITDMIYHKFANYTEGELAKMRAYLISKECLVNIADIIGIATHIIMGHSEEMSGGRKNPNNLENVLEAICGAIYLDSDIDSVRIVVTKYWEPLLTDSIFKFLDPKTKLQEILQKQSLNLPQYETIGKEGPSHSPIFAVRCNAYEIGQEIGYGKTIKAAEKDAATKILKKIQI